MLILLNDVHADFNAADEVVEDEVVKLRKKPRRGATPAPLPAQVGEEELPADEDEIISEDDDYTRTKGEF